MLLARSRRFAFLCPLFLAAGCAGEPATPVESPPGGSPVPSGARIVFDRAAFEMTQGGSVKVVAKVLDANGQEVPGATISYSASGDSAAAVATDGTVSGLGPGGAMIRAAAGGVKDSLKVDVIGHPDGLYMGSASLSARPFGVAVSRSGKAYVTRLDAGEVAIADATSRSVVGSVAVGSVPTGVAFNKAGTFAYVTNQYSSNIGFIDAALGTQVATVAIDANPYVVKVSPDDRKLYVSSNSDYVRVIDVATRAVTRKIPVGYAPNGFAVNPSETRLYVSSFVAGTVTEIDIATETELRTFTPGGMPQDMIVSKDGTELYVANEGGWLDVYTLATGERAARVPLAGGGFGMALSPDEAHLYISLPSDGAIQVVNTQSRNIIHTITVGGQPRRMAFTYHGGVAVVANESGKVDFVR